MPKKYKIKTRTGYKKRNRRTARKNASLAPKVALLMKQYKSDEGFIDQHLINSIGYGFSAYGLQHFKTAQGDNVIDRTGNQTIAKYILFKGDISILSTALGGDHYNRVRLVTVCFGINAGTTIGDVMQSVSGTLANRSLAINSYKKRSTDIKFKVLQDVTFTVSQNSPVKTYSKYLKIPKHCNLQKYDITGMQGPTVNAIWTYIVSDSAVVAHPIVTCNVREVFSK